MLVFQINVDKAILEQAYDNDDPIDEYMTSRNIFNALIIIINDTSAMIFQTDVKRDRGNSAIWCEHYFVSSKGLKGCLWLLCTEPV